MERINEDDVARFNSSIHPNSNVSDKVEIETIGLKHIVNELKQITLYLFSIDHQLHKQNEYWELWKELKFKNHATTLSKQ